MPQNKSGARIGTTSSNLGVALIVFAVAALGAILAVGLANLPEPVPVHVVRQCRGGTAWLSKRGDSFFYEDRTNRLPIFPQDVEAACPRW